LTVTPDFSVLGFVLLWEEWQPPPNLFMANWDYFNC